MSSQFGGIFSGIVIATISAISVTGFNMYTDLERIKTKTELLEISVKERKEALDRYTTTLHQMDKTLAVQVEATHAMKEVVKRLEASLDNKEK